MKDRIVIDLGQMMDEIFEATEQFGKVFSENFRRDRPPFMNRWDENVDYYPAYSYPPANVYMTEDKSLVFEFALAGFEEKGIDLEFRGDYMLLNAKLNAAEQHKDNVRYFKHRLKYKDIVDQRYYAPADKFDRDRVSARFRNGILTVIVPAKDEVDSKNGVKIEIVSEEE